MCCLAGQYLVWWSTECDGYQSGWLNFTLRMENGDL